MKGIFATIAVLLFFVFARAQSVNYTSGSSGIKLLDVTTIDIPTAASAPINLPFSVSGIATGQTVTITTADNNEGTATLGTDYAYSPTLGATTLSSSGGSTATQTFTVIITSKPATKKTNAILYISLNTGAKLIKKYKVIINFNSDDDKVTAVDNSVPVLALPDTAHWYVKVVTGGNFDFFNGPSIKNFAGDVTAFLPNIFKLFNKDWLKLGVEFGINNYHYFSSDSSHATSYRQGYFSNNKDYYTPTDASKIVNSVQTMNAKYDYNVWGIHADPIFTLAQNDFAQLFFKIHLEELATTVTLSPNLGKPVNDTISLAQYRNSVSTTIPSAHPVGLPTYFQKTYYDYYIGMGLPFSIKIGNKATICMSPSLGVTSIQKAIDPIFASDPVHRDIANDPSTGEVKFYTLNKFQIMTTMPGINVALGGEYRTVAANMRYFTTYIGVVLTIDKLKY